MDQPPPRFAALTATMIRRATLPVPAEPAIVVPPRLSREEVRFFLHAYVAALIVFLTWLA